MWDTIKKIFKHSSTEGSYFPSAFDKDKLGPSFTLYCAHIANAVAIGSIIYLVTQDAKSGTISAIVYSVITMVLYLMRRISSFKVDADDGEISLESEPEEKNEEK